MKKNVFVCFIILYSLSLFAQQSIDGDYWLDAGFLGYLPWEDGDWILPNRPDQNMNKNQQEELYKTLLLEAQYLLSGMIYGWKFRYLPADPAREVEENYRISLAGTIPWGSSQFQITQSWQEDRKFYIHGRYWLSETEKNRREASQSNRFADSGGKGSGNPFGAIPRQEALEAALKQSIRNYLQPRERNRPREIEGTIYLRDFPYYSTGPASYNCQVLVKIDLKPLVRYP